MTEPVTEGRQTLQPLGTVDSGAVARITGWGDIVFADETPDLRWFVAADDRWHDPASETAVRQRRAKGAPVYETRLRVPGGDVVQRAYCAVGPDGRPLVVVEFENDSRLAVVVALTRRDIAVSRPVAVRGDDDWPAPGLDLPEVPTVIPVGHQAKVRVAVHISSSATGPTAFPPRVAGADAIVRGWVLLTEQASAISVPDILDNIPVTERLVAERASIVLDPPSDIFMGADPVLAAHWLLDTREATRMGTHVVEPSETATAVEVVLGAWSRVGTRRDALSAAAIRAAAEMLGSDPRAVRDLARAVTRSRGGSLYESLAESRLAVSSELTRGAFVTAVEESLALPTSDRQVTVLSDGCPTERLGAAFEVHGLRLGGSRTMSYAVRWHGSNAAILWETAGFTRQEDGSGIELRSGADATWTASTAAGEGLLRIAPSDRADTSGGSFT